MGARRRDCAITVGATARTRGVGPPHASVCNEHIVVVMVFGGVFFAQ